MKDKAENGRVDTVSRRQIIHGTASVILAGAAGKLSALNTQPSPPTHGAEPNKDLFLPLTLWLAATNSNSDINNLSDDTLKSMGLDPSTSLGKLRDHVVKHSVLYGLIRQEFLTFEALYSYNPSECPRYADTLLRVAKLTIP